MEVKGSSSGQYLISFREAISNQKAKDSSFCSISLGKIFFLVLLLFSVFHNGPFAVFSSCAQLKYDVWIFWETGVVSAKVFEISYKKVGIEGVVARVEGWKCVAGLWWATSTPTTLLCYPATPPTQTNPVSVVMLYILTLELSHIRKKCEACRSEILVVREPVCQILSTPTMCGCVVINVCSH